MSRILIVDDDPDLLSVCTVGLTALGHQVWTAQTGADGLDQAATRAPEVIVLDLGLPDLDGLAVCRRIRPWTDVPMRGRSLDLTPREFDFLAYLARNVGKVCTRRMILENVWGPGYVKELHYPKVYAYRIRRKLGDESGELLQSDPAVGYRLALPGD